MTENEALEKILEDEVNKVRESREKVTNAAIDKVAVHAINLERERLTDICVTMCKRIEKDVADKKKQGAKVEELALCVGYHQAMVDMVKYSLRPMEE